MAKLPRHLRRRHENLGTSSAPVSLLLLFFCFGNAGDQTQGLGHAGKAFYHWATANTKEVTPLMTHTLKQVRTQYSIMEKKMTTTNKALFLNFEKVLLFLGYRKVFGHPKISWQLRNNLTIHLATVTLWDMYCHWFNCKVSSFEDTVNFNRCGLNQKNPDLEAILSLFWASSWGQLAIYRADVDPDYRY